MKKIFFFLFLHANLFAQSPWTQKASLPAEPRRGAIAFSIGNKGYIGLGYGVSGPNSYPLNDLWQYDPTTDSWNQKANGPYAAEEATCFSIGSKAYVGTSNAFGVEFWQYDTLTDSWTRIADFPGVSRQRALAFSITNKGYVGMGLLSTFTGINQDLWEYDTAINSWTQKMPLDSNTAPYREDGMAFSINNIGYVCCGGGGSGQFIDIEKYDPVTNSWTFQGFAPKSDAGVAFSIGTKGYVATGYNGNNYLDTLIEYDALANSWASKTNFPGGRRVEAIGFSINNKGYVGFGFDTSGGGHLNNDFWEYNPSVDTSSVSVPTINDEEQEISFFPNPLTDVSVLDIHKNMYDNLTIDIYNVIGTEVRQLRTSLKKNFLYRKDFIAGFYFYRITGYKGVYLGSGKFIVN